MILLLITMYVCLMMVLIHICTQLQVHSKHISLCSPSIRMEIDFMVESDSYGSDHFPIVKKRCFAS